MTPIELPTGRLLTRISEAYWCDPTSNYDFKEATLSIARDHGKAHVSWLDELFEGGIVCPDSDRPQALSIVITGPPGTGKSTLALELAYRWASMYRYTTAYVLTEAFAPWVRHNVASFGWPNVDTVFQDAVNLAGPIGRFETGGVFLTDLKSLSGFLHHGIKEALLDLFNEDPLGFDAIPLDRHVMPEIVVVDSLNTIDSTQRKEIYKKFRRLVSSGIKVLLLIGESTAQSASTEPWDFTCDVVLRLDRSEESGYLIRTVEIVKARYQSHVWGKHQLKLYENPKHARRTDQDSAGATNDPRLNLRHHPYIHHGGVFIFPSIHYVLSRYKGMSPSPHAEAQYLPSPLDPLTRLLGRGFPKGHCTGLIGNRGAHKSHLGYLQVIAGPMSNLRTPTFAQPNTERHKTLIVSLRDDESTTRHTLAQIVGQHWDVADGAQAIDDLERAGDLEITYYPPGFITPEEFFHRLLLSINRLKSGHPNCHLSVLFNSLDQLSSRFPLCAQHRIFIPGIIQMLTAETITSYFVAAADSDAPGADRDAPDDYYGLLSMAELILHFRREPITPDGYRSYLMGLLPSDDEDARERASELFDSIQSTTLSAVGLGVVRFAGGEPAGAHGLLELFKDGTEMSRVFRKRGLVFMPSVRHPGELGSV